MMHRNLLKSTIIMLRVLKKIFINRGEEYNTIKIEDKKILIFFQASIERILIGKKSSG